METYIGDLPIEIVKKKIKNLHLAVLPPDGRVRVSAPEALAGADFNAARDYYEAWSVESFSPENVTMRREIDLYCPMHAVLSVNEAGEAVLTRNVYGDGMAVEKTYTVTLTEFGPEDRQALLRGIGFDSKEEAEAWLESRKNP